MALPLDEVLKVVNHPSGDNEGLKAMGLTQIGRHTIKVLDLHQHLNSNKPSQSTKKQSFLVITRNSQGKLCGISVDEPPNLVELPREIIQSIPQSDRQSTPLEMVSHTAVVSQQEATTTILMLDLKRVREE